MPSLLNGQRSRTPSTPLTHAQADNGGSGTRARRSIAVNLFLDAKDAKVKSGDLSRASYNQYRLVCKWLKENLGANRLIDTIGPQDFIKLRSKFPSEWSTTSVTNQIVVSRTIFKWCFDNELIEKPIRYGDDFSKPSQRRRNLERAAKHKKEFTPAEVWRLHKYADDTMKAWILLGINCGYGNSDLSRLKVSGVSGVWLSVPRGKTGLDRKAWLWPETRDAIKAVLKGHDGGELLFRSETGQTLVSDDGSRDVVTRRFGRLKKDCGVDRRGVGFYSLRHVFETVAGETKDRIAVDHVMGHTDVTVHGPVQWF